MRLEAYLIRDLRAEDFRGDTDFILCVESEELFVLELACMRGHVELDSGEINLGKTRSFRVSFRVD